jgi:hypothetical protein
MEIYRGDDFDFEFSSILDDKTNYIFQPGDILKVAVKEKMSNSKYLLFKKIEIEKETDTVSIAFDHQQTKKCSKGNKILEVELTNKDGRVITLYQEKLTILEDIINE